MLDGVEQSTDRMTCGGSAKIVGGDVQIDLGAGDQSMTEQIADGDQANAGTNQMGCESVTDTMRGKRKSDTTALSPGADAFKDTAARQWPSEARSEEWCTGECGTACCEIGAQHLSKFRVQRDAALMTALPLHRDRQLFEIDVTIPERRALGGTDPGAVEQCE